ncbi:balbiani ring protein 3 isoform X2 [Agrilus planipennis]|uniref:Balbiani ring protein 3 isoform X2 n=1 Tax=Agrilus planipennis TaxID=224129 RepID=A0A1W4WER6_AGRPL|nr:balbiani ring protein 3 isoform X2 [Agrilus planipennis]
MSHVVDDGCWQHRQLTQNPNLYSNCTISFPENHLVCNTCKGNRMRFVNHFLCGVLFFCLRTVLSLRDDPPAERKCPVLTECPFRAESCSQDEDCTPDSVCCKSPCGNVCTKQLFTGCQTLRKAASRRAKALGVDTKVVRMPRCNKSGGFEQIQCDNEIVSSCWCVDEQGFELPGTRAPAVALVNCTDPKPCASHTCRMYCPHGFALAPDGCPLCKCRDPCENIKCPNSLDCQLEELACADPPCPPVPTCKRGRSLENICPVGDPLRISDSIRPFLCGNDPGKPTCPPMYQCLVQSGNDYGVCCPASLSLKKPGTCPGTADTMVECGSTCTHDLECPSVQKCCNTDQCGRSCSHPQNITECIHQRMLSELLSVSEREGRGYIPQCSEDGQFKEKQCSRNGLVCWCVDRMGRKLKGSMGPAGNVNCSLVGARALSSGRSLQDANRCESLDCAAICEYGFKLDKDGCPTCKCDDPCHGYICPEDEECIAVKEANCMEFLCPSLPVCRPKTIYANPCSLGTPLTDDITGAPIACALRSDEIGTVCPLNYECISVPGSTQSVCCPTENYTETNDTSAVDSPRSQTMCEYLHNFGENMEGTRDGMALALPQPQCDSDGSYLPTQCSKGSCWCVDFFGTKIPKTEGKGNATEDCKSLRETLECLGLTCRMGCEYGFVLDEETRCPSCQCKDPCSDIKCGPSEECQLVEVSCTDHYCPPVPACLPKKNGQCPYLIPATSTSCDFECTSDLSCDGTQRCCSNGCGTQCVEPLLLTGCQHERHLLQHQANEAGKPAGQVYIPTCADDGNYASKQCDYGKQQCWCVDFRGFEVSKTRRSISEPLDCDNLPEEVYTCPMRKCVQDCVHGYEMDENGCRSCTCKDPCSKISCRGEGEICRLVDVECTTWPCPPMAMCLPKKENPCHNGEPLKLGNSNELATCGPEYEGCPSTHKCQLSPLGEYAVCCPKPRDVCFEPMETGSCSDPESFRNLTRFYFNSRKNKCEPFSYSGCRGNHNNFHSEETCNLVCPVLSQCERLKAKNQKSAERYKKPTFTPRCDQDTGSWQPVQCLEHVGVCWCVTPHGEPLKGTLTRGSEPECNFRQARGRGKNKAQAEEVEVVLEELMMQLGSIDYDEEEDDMRVHSTESAIVRTSSEDVMDSSLTRCQALKAQCDEDGKFLPTQCEKGVCWCVDEAGRQLQGSGVFYKDERNCKFTPVEEVEVILGLRGNHDEVSAIPIVNRIQKIVVSLNGTIKGEDVRADPDSDVLYIKFSLIGNNKVDVAYKLEELVRQKKLSELTADFTLSSFINQLGYAPAPIVEERIVALENREIVSQSPVSVTAPYHTALIVVAAGSAFVISVLVVLIILYRRKMASLKNKVIKSEEGNQRFLSPKPFYVELPNEKSPAPVRTSPTSETT